MSARPKDTQVATRAQWDKKPFRITRIPGDYDQDRLSQVVMDLLKLKISDFKIHSLATDVSYEGDPEWKVATISFRIRPPFLEESLVEGGKWSFTLQSSPTYQSSPGEESSRIYFDLHFKGFTPLSPMQDDGKHMIEYESLKYIG